MMMAGAQYPADRRDAASRDLTLAVLATRLSELSAQVGVMAARLESTEAAVESQAGALAEAAGLAREVGRLSAAIAGQRAPADPGFAPVHPRERVWAAMSPEEYLDALRDVGRWVTEILLRRYPQVAEALPPCWPAHESVVEELDWLYWDWTGWAVNPEARSRDAADWHDRWLPGVVARIRPLLASCTVGHRSAQYRRPAHRELQGAGYVPDAVFIERMGADAARRRPGASR